MLLKHANCGTYVAPHNSLEDLFCLRLCQRSTIATHSGVSHALAALLRQNQHALSLMPPSWPHDNVISKNQIPKMGRLASPKLPR